MANSVQRPTKAPASEQANSTTPPPTSADAGSRQSDVLKTHKDESARGRQKRLFSAPGLGLKSRSIVIRDVRPRLEEGRFPVKREVGDILEVSAKIFREGHDKLTAVLLYRRQAEKTWREVPMTLINQGLDQWTGSVELTDNAMYVYTIEAWTDVYASWCDEMEKKLEAGQNVTLELREGRELIGETAGRATGADAESLGEILKRFDQLDDVGRAGLLMDDKVRAIETRWPDRGTAVRCDQEFEVMVDRVIARFAAWYEMFPRSQGKIPGQSGTFDDCIARFPEVRALGFNVVYFVPIHPIGRAYRKGPNNTLEVGPNDPGSPYAIGAEEGGHKAIHPDLGTLEDFRRLVKASHEHGMEVALDFAIQCSPDHPWIKEHPEWFLFRPDGTIKYAENPPKKYQDIVNVDFFNEHWESLWHELKSTFEFWIDQGVKIFRVDNPHTKPVPFWEWVIREIKAKHPDVIFLAEAFTRPEPLSMLAKVGYSQSYTYFTWRHTKQELTEYLTELTQTELSEYLRPNFFTNTPDINPPFLQTGGRPAHMIRMVLAATLSSVYGIYSGFELCEATPIPGKEEYLNSEKYEIKVWDWDRPGNIKDYIARINRIRAENLALHELDNLRFYRADDDNVLFYGKMTPDRSNMVFVVVNLDPFNSHDSFIWFPLAEMGLGDSELFVAEEQLSNRRLDWRGSRQWVRLDPQTNPCEIFRISVQQ
jgi:starch synthase (maltosyl-transferring)